MAETESGVVSPIEPLKDLILEANQAQKWVKEGNELELKPFLKKVSSSRILRAQTLTVIFKNPLFYWLKPLSPIATPLMLLNNLQTGGGGGN